LTTEHQLTSSENITAHNSKR